MASSVRLALKLIWRDWRSGELSILVFALLIAVTASTAISMLGSRLNQTMTQQAAEFLGADMAVSSHQPPAPNWGDNAKKLGLEVGETIEFPSVLVEHNELLLVSVKAVSEGYPLRGALMTTDHLGGETEESHHGPEPGEAWVEPQVLAALKVLPGQMITIGEKSLHIGRLILREPDRRGDVYSLSPRVLINRMDVAASNVIQPGSNVHYYSLFKGPLPALKAFKRWLRPHLQAGQQIADILDDRPELGKAIQRAERYLGLASIAVVLIAGVSIAMSARRYTARHFDLVAILKCLGARDREILILASLQFLIIGVVVTIMGCFLGWVLQFAIVSLVQDLLPHAMAPPGIQSWLLGGASGLLILIGFALPPVLRLQKLPPLRVLRRDLEPVPSSGWLVYTLATITLTILLWQYTGDWDTTLTVLGTCGLFMAVFGGAGFALLSMGRRLLPHAPLPVRLGLQQLTRHPRTGTTQILAFSITLIAMQIVLLTRTELIGQWKQQIPDDAPNYFALNLFDDDLPHFRQFLRDKNLAASESYPVIRGRLLAVNGQNVSEMMMKDSRLEGAINRELSLTWATTLPPDNRVISGQWPHEIPGISVSVEEDLANRLGVHTGDQLTFTIGGQTLQAVVGSTRSVHWDSMTPNFYMIFGENTLNGFPHTWLTSFFVADTKKDALPLMVKSFPALTLLDVGKMIDQLREILQQITLAITFILFLAIIAGFSVLFATVRATLDERIHEYTILRTLGAGSRLLRVAQWTEFSALGYLSGLLSVAVSELITWAIYRRLFSAAYHFHTAAWVIVPVVAAMVIGLAGLWQTREVTRVSPLRVLREL